jgi:hypothetical protein
VPLHRGQLRGQGLVLALFLLQSRAEIAQLGGDRLALLARVSVILIIGAANLIERHGRVVHELVLGSRQLTAEREQHLTPDTCQQGALKRQLFANEVQQVR